MFSWFKSNKEKDRDLRFKEKELEINALKAENERKAKEAAAAIRKLNDLVEREGISGVFFIATGAERKSRRRA